MGIRGKTLFFFNTRMKMRTSQSAVALFSEADEEGYFYVNCTLSASPVVL